MYELHLCIEYMKGVDAFINFTKKDMLDSIRGNLLLSLETLQNKKRCIYQFHKERHVRQH
jgi:hypothetical protein